MSQINHIEMFARCHNTSSDATEYLWLEIVVDAQVIVDFKYYAVDLEELTRSIQSSGEFFILTCWCGEPSCTGIKKGIQVAHEQEFFFWKVSEPKQFNFKFEKNQCEAEIRKVIKQGKQLLVEAKHKKMKFPEIVPEQNVSHFKLN